MLTEVADGVLVHQSDFCQSNAVVARGTAGVLLVDPGIRDDEMIEIAEGIEDLGQSVAVGFSTHPHWDHLLWHARLGDAPRYGTERCATTIGNRLADPGFPALLPRLIPPDVLEQMTLDGLGLIAGVPMAAAGIPWDGPEVRIVEHQAHAPGHAALVIPSARVLIAGDMLSDLLVPVLDFMNATDPVEDYLSALQLFDDVVDEVDVVVPGHGSVGDRHQLLERIARDRAYLLALRDGAEPDDARLGPAAPFDWVVSVHERQRAQLAQ